MSTLTALPKAAVTGYLRLLRLPIDAAERFAGHGDENGSWPPALAFDAFEAQVLGLLGSVLRDDELVQEAERQRARVTQLRRAAELEVAATQRRVEADQELDHRRQAAQAKAESAEERAEQAEAQIDQQKAEANGRVRQEAAAKATQVRKTAEARSERIEERERDNEAARLQAERETLAQRKDALEATGEAIELDQAADAVKQRRRRRA